MNKHTNDSNRRMFAPFALRDLAPSERVGSEPASYVKLDGLGKIAYSSVKRPKPLMDMIAQPVIPRSEDKVRFLNSKSSTSKMPLHFNTSSL